MNLSSSNAAVIGEALSAAADHLQGGRLAQAEELYRAVLQLEPQHGEANHRLGLLAAQLGQLPAALHFLQTAVAAQPQQSEIWRAYRDVLLAAGETAAAQEVAQLAQRHGIVLDAALAAAAMPVIATASTTTVAATTPAAATSARPTAAELQALDDAHRRHDLERLEQLGLACTQKYPAALEGWKALSLAYYFRGRFDLALTPTLRMLELAPENAQMHANLGLMLWRLRRLDEAETCFRNALARDATASDTHVNLGNVYKDMGRPDAAMACYRRAIELDPQQAVAFSNLGFLLMERGALRQAEENFRTALKLAPDSPYVLRNLSTVLLKLGHLVEAEAVIRQAIAAEPDNLLAYDLLLFLFNYTQVGQSQEGRKLAERYGQLVAGKRALRYAAWQCAPDPQRLRIGLVSADMHNHPVGLFVESLVRHIDPARIELFAYVHMPEHKYDAVTQRLHASFSAWKSIYRLDDKDAAALIHADGIHVLLDLSGHTTDNRLPLFAWKPAPVQASWLGYFATTGVAEMDYLIGDPYLCPPEEEGDFTETVWRLPQTWLAFTPPQEAAALEAVAPLPALRNGYITFGCCNNLNKMNDAVVALWARLLQCLPDTRLLLKAPQLRDPLVQDETRARFAAHGVAAERLLLEGPAPRGEYLQAYARIDIALDPFPYPGGATSVDALWMGVPVLTMRGNRFLAHLGESVAHNAGLAAWIAADAEDYLAKAEAFAADLPVLAALRSGLRAQLQASPLLDVAGFARGFADALWRMWAERGTAAGATPPSPAVKTRPLPAGELAKLKQLGQQQRYPALEKQAATCVRKYPHSVDAWQALSLAQYHNDQLEAALESTRRLLALQPDDIGALNRLALILIGLGRVSEEAEASLQRAIELAPRHTDAHINLAYIRRRQGQLDEALACYARAIELNPALAAAHTNLGVIQLEQLQLRAAEASFRKALALQPKDLTALVGLGSVLTKLGLLAEAETLARRTIALDPGNAQAYSTLLFLLNYGNAEHSAEALALARQYGAAMSRKARKPYTQWSCEPMPTRLKVGLVSGDLYNHPVGYFLEGLLRALDPARIEIVAYANRPARRDDAMSARLRAYCTGWKNVDALDDAQLAAQIHADGIHVLLDLAGHTGDTRLPVFAYRPAPVQAAWLGYFATTGIEQMDYLIGDPNVCPPEEANHFTETIWRLPETYLCFTPPDADIPVNELPARQNGHITFGCFNNIGKLGDAVVATWSRILQRLPDARLLLKARQLADPAVCAWLRERFAAHGIVGERLLLEGPTQRLDYLKAYQRVDIVLDPFPYPGGTTTMEALWMSVPVITLRGKRMLSHAGENILRNVGLPEWIATDTDDYIAKAIDIASNLEMLTTLRSRLRAQALASPMFDAPRFARFFEDALWEIFRQRQDRLNAASATRLLR